jgi:alpha-L-rhamnosidase
MTGPTHLRVEHLDRPMGTTVPAPRLSWRLPPGTLSQAAYEVEVDGVSGGRVSSPDQVLVPWPVAPLRSRQSVTWRVKVWTEAGESDWSAPSRFETGLLEASDWVARWVEPIEDERLQHGERPAYVLRSEFHVAERGPARLYATAHGIYEVFLNGVRVGDVELAPGFTSYHANLHVQTYDVTGLLTSGRNTWEVLLSDGWYRGRTGFTQAANCYGDTTAFLGQLHLGDAVVSTDDTWEFAVGQVVAADLMAGQRTDLCRAATEWRAVRVRDHDLDRLTSSPAPPTRRVEEVRPQSVRRLTRDRQVVDLGQNINGWVRLTKLGPRGTTLALTHGEALDSTGDVTQDHLDAIDFANDMAPLDVGMIDHVTSAGQADDVFEPRHTTHGFRYVRVEGHLERLTPDDISGVVVHSDLRRTGWFRCSDERINRFHEITEWSLYDVAGFSTKWLRDLVADTGPDGRVSNVAPDPARPKMSIAEDPTWTQFQGSSGWGDAITIVPWELWRRYGDEQVLAECWTTMVGWVDFAATVARTMRHPSRAERRPEPAPHEAFIWDGGFHWGEWLEPQGFPDADSLMADLWTKDKGDVGTAYLHRSALLAGRVGRLLGKDAEVDRLETLAANALEAWRREFIGSDGSLTPDTQANHVRALAFDLVPDDLREQTAARLVELVRAAHTHLETGFLATPYLLPVLADGGHLDVAYELLLQDTPPSWLYMVERGATTVWEAWEALGPDGTPRGSLNHYSKGAVIQFLHTHTAGIQPVDDTPAYRRFRVEPRPGGGLTWAEGVYDSPYGRIESSWRIHGERFELTVTVPAGTTAEVVLPDGTRNDVGPGAATHVCTLR